MSLVSGRSSQAMRLVAAAAFAAGPAAVLGAATAVCSGETASLAKITAAAPECFAADACSAACSPVAALLSKYDKDAIKGSECANREHLKCFYQAANKAHCSKVFTALQKIDIELPKTEPLLMAPATCAAVVVNTKATCVTKGGTSTVVQKGVVDHPECFEQCPDVCDPLADLQVMAEKDVAASVPENKRLANLTAALCKNARPFRCLLETANTVKCAAAIKAGATALGIPNKLPTTIALLDSMCKAPEKANSTKLVAGARGVTPGAWSVAAAAVVAGSVLPFAAAAH